MRRNNKSRKANKNNRTGAAKNALSRKQVKGEYPTINGTMTIPLNLTTKSVQERRFFDRGGTTNASTTVAQTSLLDQMLSTTGLLATFDSMVNSVFVGTTQRYMARVHISHMDVRLHCINALSNGVVVGDSYNTLRVYNYVTATTYQGNKANALSDVVSHPLPSDVLKPLCDESFTTWISAFDSTDDGSPTHELRNFSCPINLTIDCVSESGRTVWDTKAGDVMLEVISDSSVTPHPQLIWAYRVYYDVLQ
jgi:hypothetical protein